MEASLGHIQYSGPIHQRLSVRTAVNITQFADGTAFCNPFICSIVHLEDGPSATSSLSSSLAVQIHLSPTLTLQQTVPIPTPTAGSLSITAFGPITSPIINGTSHSVSVAHILIITTPTDKTTLASEGSTVWTMTAGDIGKQIDQLVKDGQVADAVGLVKALGDSDLSPVSSIASLGMHFT
jgi:hypothetical protein